MSLRNILHSSIVSCDMMHPFHRMHVSQEREGSLEQSEHADGSNASKELAAQGKNIGTATRLVGGWGGGGVA